MKVIFTNRPINLLSPISWVNAITRWKTKSPFDHVAIMCGDMVYESTSGFGVREIKYKDWVKGREGSYLFIYEDDDHKYDLSVFYHLKGSKYDYKANLLYLFGLHNLLSKRNNKRQFCSELIMRIKGRSNPFFYTPEDIQEELSIEEKACMIVKVK